MENAERIGDGPQWDAGQIESWAGTLEGRSPEDVLLWSAGEFSPRVTFATAFGPEGCVLIDLIGRAGLPIDVFTLDTGLLFPETRDLWARLEDRYDLTIRAVRPPLSVNQQAVIHGDRLWARNADRCCEMRKVLPLRTALRGFDAWISSIRRDQTKTRAGARVVEWDASFGLIKVNPLAGWTSEDVWAHLRAHDVPHNALHAQGYPSVGCWPCTSAVGAGEDPRAGRWRGSAKTECGLHLRPAPVGPRAVRLSAAEGA